LDVQSFTARATAQQKQELTQQAAAAVTIRADDTAVPLGGILHLSRLLYLQNQQ
jgi:hypothetical protein